MDRFWPRDITEAKERPSLINEPLPPEPPRESATARAVRIWFKQNLSGMSGARDPDGG